MGKKAANGETVIIKKYANRRLYDTSTSSYVTLDHLSELVRGGTDFVVVDAKSGDDLTRSVLTQIIFEQENKGSKNVLPLGFLREVIKFYGDNFQSVLPAYLEMSMKQFSENQHRWRDALAKTIGGNPMALFEAQTRQNLELFEQSMSVLSSPMGRGMASGSGAREPESHGANGHDPSPPPASPAEEMMAQMQKQMLEMQKQLAELSGKKPD